MRTPKSQEHREIAAKGASAGNPILGTPTIVLTIGQIVERLRPSNPATVFERLRHWTKEGLISPVDQHHSGTGTPKLYEFDSPFDCAVLNALAVAGVQVLSRPYIKTALRETRNALAKYRDAQQAKRKPPALSLVISQQVDGEPTVTLHEGAVKHDPATQVAIVINLTQLFAHVS
jgi:hypothetical protein